MPKSYFFSSKRCKFLHNTLLLLISFRVSILKSTAKAPAEDHLRLDNPRCAKIVKRTKSQNKMQDSTLLA